MSLPDILILTLACWRVAFLVTNDKLPFGYLREWLQNAQEGRFKRFAQLAYELVSCIRCVSVYAACGVFLLWIIDIRWIVYVAAISGGALMLHRYVGWEYEKGHD